ncbi:MAG: phosphoadenylyl-sulfate reductase, partial [Bacteroidota bacterium]|nr:phosphoadenylyl-sulfate reductase [Bacteroidota bacterium]
MLNKIKELNKKVSGLEAEDIIRYFAGIFQNKITFATSLGAEDQVLTDIICKIDKGIPIFTLDTGRLFYETYNLIDKTEKYYKIKILKMFPDYIDVEKMVFEKGINLFYDSIDNRKLCCNVRKIKSLKRALHGYEAWICGLRKGQSVTRADINVVEFDELNNIIKINPLINW